MKTMNDDYGIINKTMEALDALEVPLNRSALCIAIDDGITTQETYFTYYMLGVNIYHMLSEGKALSLDEEADKVTCRLFCKEDEDLYRSKWIDYRKGKEKDDYGR